MERIYTDYTASGRQVVLNNVPASFSAFTVENIRLIFNETQKNAKGKAIDPLVSTGVKENVEGVSYDGTNHTITIVLADNVPEILATDKLTIKIDMGESVSDLSGAIIEIDTGVIALEATTAKEATLGASPDTSVSRTVFGWLKSIRDFLVGIVTTAPYAKESTLGSISQTLGQSTDTAFSDSLYGAAKTIKNELEDSTSGLAAIKTAIGEISIDTSGLAQRTDVKDGNDTAISMLKDQTNGLAAIKTAINNHNTEVVTTHPYAKETTVGSPNDATGSPTLFGKLADLLAAIEGQGGDPGDLPEGLADRILLLLQFFGIEGSFEAEAKGGETTSNPVIDECKLRFSEDFEGLLPSGFTMPNSVTIDGNTYTGTVASA